MEAALYNAAAKGDARKVEELLSQGGRVDSEVLGFTPLLAAATKGHVSTVALLMSKGAVTFPRLPSL